MATGSTLPCGSDRRELRRERGFCSGSEEGADGFPFESALFLSFDREPLARPFDVFFVRLGADGGAGPGESAAVVVVVGVVADETGRDGPETKVVGFGRGEGPGRTLSAGSSSMRSFSLKARVSRARESGIGRGATSIHCVREIGDRLDERDGTFEKL